MLIRESGQGFLAKVGSSQRTGADRMVWPRTGDCMERLAVLLRGGDDPDI